MYVIWAFNNVEINKCFTSANGGYIDWHLLILFHNLNPDEVSRGKSLERDEVSRGKSLESNVNNSNRTEKAFVFPEAKDKAQGMPTPKHEVL